jgi:hypothetical protein
MAVIRIRPGDPACRICGASSAQTHQDIHDCVTAIDREMQTLLKKTKSLTARRSRLIARELAGIRKKALDIDRRARTRKRPRSA